MSEKLKRNKEDGNTFFRKLCCRMGWHSPSRLYIPVKHDGYKGIANEYKCPWCGYVGMVDSQGNLF